MKKKFTTIGAMVGSLAASAFALTAPAQAAADGPDDLYDIDSSYVIAGGAGYISTTFWKKWKVFNAPDNEYNHVLFVLRGCHGKVLDRKEFNKAGTYTFTIGKRGGYDSRVLGPNPTLEVNYFWNGKQIHKKNAIPREITNAYRSVGSKCPPKQTVAEAIPATWVEKAATKNKKTVLKPRVGKRTGVTKVVLSKNGKSNKAKVRYRWFVGGKVVKQGPAARAYVPKPRDAGKKLQARAIVHKKGHKNRVKKINFGTIRTR